MPKQKQEPQTLYKCVNRWANYIWQKNGEERFDRIEDQFQIGNQFIRFIEISSRKEVPRDVSLIRVLTAFLEPGSKKSVTSTSPNHDCIAIGMYFLRFTENFSLKNISVNDIASGFLPSIVKILYSISIKYIFQDIEERTDRWTSKSAKEVIVNYFKNLDKDLKVRNFRNLLDGSALCALIQYYNPNIIECNNVKKDNKVYNFSIAFNILEKQFNIPKLIEPEDMDFVKYNEKAYILYLGVIITGLLSMSQDFNNFNNDHFNNANNSTSNNNNSNGSNSSNNNNNNSKSQKLSSSSSTYADLEVVILKAKITTLERKVEQLNNFANRLKMSFTVLLNEEDSKKEVENGNDEKDEVLTPHQLTLSVATLERRLMIMMKLIMEKTKMVDELYLMLGEERLSNSTLEKQIEELTSLHKQTLFSNDALLIRTSELENENDTLKAKILELQHANLEHQKTILLQSKTIEKLNSPPHDHPGSSRRAAPSRGLTTKSAVDLRDGATGGDYDDDSYYRDVEDVINELNL